MSQVSQVTWSVVIPTYQRPTVLLRCLRLIAQQTWPPKEVIIVDASPDWEATHAKILQQLAMPPSSTIQWHHIPARRLSSASQRNQGIELATSDVIFLIDDDSFMYPDCAAEVMQIYIRDTDHKVAGVMPALEFIPPDQTIITSPHLVSSSVIHTIAKQWRVIQGILRGKAKHWIGDDNIFIPYDFSFPSYHLPETLTSLAVHPVTMVHGARMSYRWAILQQVRFEETLERYAVNEDNDVCYRASRLGILLHALQAKICHIESPIARVSRFTATALWGLNQAVLHCFHSPDLPRFKKLFWRLLWRRLLTQTIKDLLDRRWTLPSPRGVWFVLRHSDEIFTKTPAELRRWYPEFQRQLLLTREGYSPTKRNDPQ